MNFILSQVNYTQHHDTRTNGVTDIVFHGLEGALAAGAEAVLLQCGSSRRVRRGAAVEAVILA